LTADGQPALIEFRMTKTTLNVDTERFRSGADKYAAYLETPEGRLRLDLAFANLQEFFSQASSLRALDLGCGTGAIAIRLARLGFHVTLLDSSRPMLDFAERAAREAGLSERISLTESDAAEVANLFPAESFDVILCHNVLEYVPDPVAVLRGAARTLRGRSAILSVLVRNQAGEVMKAAIQNGDLASAEQALIAEWGTESLYGGSLRLFTTQTLRATLTAASLTVIAERGVRVISDYLPPHIDLNTNYEKIVELERKLGSRSEFAAVARYTHWIAHLASSRGE
jgi:S-adenosylmethionine-dependent methyltransferase